jgi:transcriptional regulator
MLYMPPAFKVEDVGVLHDHIDKVGLALLVTVAAGRALVSHVPMMLERGEGPHGTLHGHLAKGNPQIKETLKDTPATAVFQGPEAYVSPGWYAAKREHGRVVPTWNYAVVHARGPIEFFAERERLHGLVDKLTARHERRFAVPWATSDAPAGYIDSQLKGIVGFSIAIAEIEGKYKLSQNRPEADHAGVVEGLARAERETERATAAMMRGADGRLPRQ